MSSKKTYSVIARDPNSWTASTGIHCITWECGHRHRTYLAAAMCEDRHMGNGRNNYPAYMHHARIESSGGDIHDSQGRNVANINDGARS